MRWSEEVLLLREEMRRVLAFLEWHEGWWEERQMLHNNLELEQAEGMKAYAKKQASIRQGLRSTFNRLWRHSDELIALGVGSDNEILDLQDIATQNILAMPALG
jgi:hypothetical protein